MAVDAELRCLAEFQRLLRQIAIEHVHDQPAPRANQVMMVGLITDDVAVAAIGFVDPAEEAEPLEQFQSTEDGCPPDVRRTLLDVGQDIASGEMALVRDHRFQDQFSLIGDAVTLAFQCLQHVVDSR